MIVPARACGLVTGLLVSTWLLDAATARAETGPLPPPPPVCDEELVLPVRETVSRWQRVFFVRDPRRSEPAPVSIRLEEPDGTDRSWGHNLVTGALPGSGARGTFIDAPNVPVAGSTLVLHYQRCDGATLRLVDATSRFRVTESSPTAPPLGELTISQLYAANQERGADNRVYFVVVTLDSDAGLATWDDILTLHLAYGAESVAVGAFQSGTRAASRREVTCPAASADPDPRVLEVEASARIGESRSNTILAIETMREISCAGALRVDFDTLEPLSPEEIAYWDDPGPTAPPPPSSADASELRDASSPSLIDGASIDADMTREVRDFGCGCSAPGRDRRTTFGGLACVSLIATAASRVRRRRRVTSSCGRADRAG